jgi:hypothetical protein
MGWLFYRYLLHGFIYSWQKNNIYTEFLTRSFLIDVQLNMSIAHDRNRDLVLLENPRDGLHNPVGEPGTVF